MIPVDPTSLNLAIELMLIVRGRARRTSPEQGAERGAVEGKAPDHGDDPRERSARGAQPAVSASPASPPIDPRNPGPGVRASERERIVAWLREAVDAIERGEHWNDHAEVVPTQVLVLGDYSGKFTPPEWARIVLDKYLEGRCDLVVVETNRGGDLVVQNLRAAAAARGLSVVVVGKDERPVHQAGVIFVKEVHARGPKQQGRPR